MAEALPVYWYVIIAVLWLGYLALEGFDLGVGMLMQAWARDERRRRVLLNVIGPVWEGNEVWLITAIGAMFAAFHSARQPQSSCTKRETIAAPCFVCVTSGWNCSA